MPSAKQKAFDRKVKALVKKANRLEATEVKRTIALLANARKEIAAVVASSDWQIHRLSELKAAVERALTDFGNRYGIQLRDTQREFWETGLDLVDLPLREAGIIQAMPEIDTTVLSILQGYGTDLVDGLTRDATKKINTEITLGIMGQKAPTEVMGAIGRNLKSKSIFKSIAARAETITMTEAGRVLEAASQARKVAAASVVPGLQKQWHYGHSPKQPRPAHLAAHGQVRDVDKPFDVGGEKLMYPKDPAGSAKNTIRCGCTSLPYHPRWEELGQGGLG